MDSWHKILAVISTVLLLIVLWQGCGPGNTCPELITEKKDTVRHETYFDTTWTDSTVIHYFKAPVPIPYIDTIPYYDTNIVNMTKDDFDQLLGHQSIYTDTIRDDTVSVFYRLKVRGFLDEAKIGYTISAPYLVTKTEIIETEVTKRIKGKLKLYLGLDIGGNEQSFSHLAPMLELSTIRYNYNVGYNLMNKSVIIGMRVRIGKKIK